MKKLLLYCFTSVLFSTIYAQTQPLTATFNGIPGCKTSARLVINATGGVPPYKYSSNGIYYEDSNTLQLSYYDTGAGTGYVKDSRDSVVSGAYVIKPFENWNYVNGGVYCGGTFSYNGMNFYNITRDTVIDAQMYRPCGIGGYRFIIKVLPAYNKKDTISICAGTSYTFADQVKLINVVKDTEHTTTYKMKNGCDSLVTTLLKIFYQQIETSDTVCYNGSYTFPDGVTITNIINPLVYATRVRLPDSCWAFVAMDIFTKKPDASITLTSNLLISNASNASYQWGVCSSENNFTPISGEILNYLTVPDSKYYRVAIEEHGCKDTSECVSILVTGVEQSLTESILVYPNPVVDYCAISFKENLAEAQVEVYNSLGVKVIEVNYLHPGDERISLLNVPGGIYFLKVTAGSRKGVVQVSKY